MKLLLRARVAIRAPILISRPYERAAEFFFSQKPYAKTA